jgi:GxxExxY protein
MNTDDKRFDDLTYAIIGCAFEVHNELGHGFLESVYERALIHELGLRGLRVERQVPLSVTYKGVVVGDYIADLLVEGLVLIELKAIRAIDPAHIAQCINYVTATRVPIGLVINFGIKVEHRRVAGPTLRDPSVQIGAPSAAKNPSVQ